jgi:hypothetical protein
MHGEQDYSFESFSNEIQSDIKKFLDSPPGPRTASSAVFCQ